MKIVIIYGQQHHGNTYKLTHQLLNKFDCQIGDITEIYVNGMPQCVGCYQCVLKGEQFCPFFDKVNPIIKAMLESDIIIVASPCYCFEMTGQLKSFFDHLAYAWMPHRPYNMANKIGIVISTAAGSGANKVTKSLAQQLLWLSVGRIYRIPFVVAAQDFDSVSQSRKKKLNVKLDKIASHVNKSSGCGSPTIREKLLFKIMAIYHQHSSWNPLETAYWKSKGWIQ